jgi:hypothetical protein
MSNLQVATANRSAHRPVYTGGGGGTDQPVPAGFTGILPPADGTLLIVDANDQFTDLVPGYSQGYNGVYRRESIGAYASNGTARRQYYPAYFSYVRLDAVIGFGLTGVIGLKITRQSDELVVYNQTLNTNGPDDNSYVGGLEWTGPKDVYLVEFYSASSVGVAATDGIALHR